MQGQNSIRGTIALAIDVVFAIALFYGFQSWSNITDWFSKCLAILVYLIILVDWLSIRASSKIYTIRILILDLTDLFIFANIFNELKIRFGSYVLYSPVFWIYLAALCFVYMLWNISVSGKIKLINDKTLRRWALANMILGITCLLTYAGLVWLEKNASIVPYVDITIIVVALPAILYWLSLLTIWAVTIVSSLRYFIPEETSRTT
jgi:hypothetical protein